MQPYFLPYLGYFSLIKNTDEMILFDTVQFIRHGWIERNRILKQNGGWQYFQVPLIKDNGRESLIKDVKIDNLQDWKGRILARLQHYRKQSPYYFRTINLLKEVFSKDYEDIVSLNKESLRIICQFLGIEREFPIFSQMGLEIEPAKSSDEWALNICLAIDGVNEYWNPIGGISFFDRKKYENAGVNLIFQQMVLKEYNQGRDVFEPGLSIIDVMMFNSPEEINSMLNCFELL